MTEKERSKMDKDFKMVLSSELAKTDHISHRINAVSHEDSGGPISIFFAHSIDYNLGKWLIERFPKHELYFDGSMVQLHIRPPEPRKAKLQFRVYMIEDVVITTPNYDLDNRRILKPVPSPSCFETKEQAIDRINELGDSHDEGCGFTILENYYF